MQHYELMYILPVKLSEEEKNTVVERVNSIITRLEGTVKDHTTWMTRKLSYPINHIRQGVFMLAHIDVPKEQLNALRRELDLDEDIIRHLLTIIDPQQAKAPVLRPRPVPTPQDAPQEDAPAVDEKVSEVELDKKLEEILTDE